MGYSAKSTGWRDTWWDPLASRSGGILRDVLANTGRGPLASCSGRSWAGSSCSGGILGAIHWRAALAGYLAGSAGEPLWRDTRRDPLARGSSGELLWRDTWREAALAGYSEGSTGEQLWRDTRRDPLTSRSGGIWRDTRRDPLASCYGGILGGGVV